MGHSRKCGRRFRVRTQDPRVLGRQRESPRGDALLGEERWPSTLFAPLYKGAAPCECSVGGPSCPVGVYLPCDVLLSPPPTPSQGGGGTSPMAPPPAVTPKVSRPSSSMAQTPTPARSTKTAPQQRLQSSSPLPPLHHFQHEGEQAWQSHHAATILQCWKWRIWLCRWSDQQAMSKQKRLRLQTLCRGASTYASSVRGNRRPPPTRPKRPLDPKVLSHPFRTHSQPLPPRKRGQRHKRLRRRPGRRHRPLAPDSVCH